MQPHARGRLIRRLVWAAMAAWLLAWELHVLLAPGTDFGPLFSRFAHDLVLVGASAMCLWAGVVAPSRGERRAWLVIGAGVAAWAFGEVYYTAVLWTAEEIPIPSPADGGYLLFPPLMLVGVLMLLRSRTHDVPGTLWADGVTAALAVSAASAALVFETVRDSASGQAMEIAVSLAYPIADLVLLGLIVGALAGTGWQLDRTWVLLAGGVATFWLADSLYLVRTTAGTYESGNWFEIGWWLGLVMIAAASWQPVRRTQQLALDERLRRIVVPVTFGAGGLSLLVYGAIAGSNTVTIVLAAASLLAVMCRTMLTFRDNVSMLRASRVEATTDALTGLGNRRALARALERELPRAEQMDPLVLVLFDLDGFKQYNDTFGHPAGDALLVRLGTGLAGFVEGRGTAYRMGGDEFCALLRPGSRSATPLVAGAAAALSEHGDGFAIGCSYGAIHLPAEAAEAAEALRIADQRMYAQKNAGRTSATRQSKDVLLRALAERNPDVRHDHVATADLAEATARQLGLGVEEVEQIRHATELRDVGKVAMPDAILTKPGPLDEDEWAFIRRHTIIGERIIAAAPALTRIAGLVRASHERWDGAGYPDSLEGERIPLGARIVAVADAFAAMTSTRPYAVRRSAEAALAELEACAGTQFDPEIVAAFTVAFRDQQIAAAA